MFFKNGKDDNQSESERQSATQISALVRSIPQATILEGSHGHIRIPLDVSIYKI